MADQKQPKTHKVGDVIDVPKGAEHMALEDGVVVTVRAGGTYRFGKPGKHTLTGDRVNRTYTVVADDKKK